MQWFAQAPSNIALIKYMGKKEVQGNIPINPSLSYTLNKLLSSVSLESIAGKVDYWEPLIIPGGMDFELSSSAQARFLKHLAFLKSIYKYEGAFIVRSNNNFPHSSGLASSAASFAALTKCALLALSELKSQPVPNISAQANLSRYGSGSSCRSFFSPWALWQEETVESITLPYTNLIHQVIVISHDEKKVPSSEAHERIRTSPLYAGRADRAKHNLKVLLEVLEAQDWRAAFDICWREFQDLHQLFSTSVPEFSYMDTACKAVLTQLQDFWEQEKDGPIVTMDAGPNIHLLYRPDQETLAAKFKQHYLVGNYDFL